MGKLKRKGWRGESKRHAKSAKGIKTGRRKIGTTWKGKRYIHGPRLKYPGRYAEFRLGKPTKRGERLVFGRIKGTNKWEIQSKLMPRNYSIFFDIFGKKKKEREEILTAIKEAEKEGFSPYKKGAIVLRKKPKNKPDENYGDWTDIKKWELDPLKLKELQIKRAQWIQAKELRETFKRSKREKQTRLRA